MYKWTKDQLSEYEQRTKVIYKLFLQILCEEFPAVKLFGDMKFFDNINQCGDSLIEETISLTDADPNSEFLLNDISVRTIDDFSNDLLPGFSTKYNFEYDPKSPEGAALIHVLHVCIQHIISTKKKTIGRLCYSEREFLSEFRSLLLPPKKGPYRKKENPLQERRYTRLREQITSEFREKIKEKAPRPFDQALLLVISDPSKPQWLKKEYATYRKHKIWYKFVKEINHPAFVKETSELELTTKDLLEEKYPHRTDDKIDPEVWWTYLYKNGEKKFSFAKKMDFFTTPEFLKYAKKYRNTTCFRKGFIQYLLAELWPKKSKDQIIELLK